MVVKKVCGHCREEKPINEFGKNHSRKSGIECWCKSCISKSNKEYHQSSSAKLRRLQYTRRPDIIERQKELNNQHWRQYPFRIWAVQTINNHKTNKHIIKVSISEVEELAKESPFCSYCGKKLDWVSRKMNDRNPTLERIDNENELRLDNIAVVCRECNSTKQNRTFFEFVKYCENIVKKFGRGTP